MPYSLVLYCYPKENLAREEIAGKRLHGIFFNLLREADSRLTDELCQKNTSPFTRPCYLWLHLAHNLLTTLPITIPISVKDCQGINLGVYLQ